MGIYTQKFSHGRTALKFGLKSLGLQGSGTVLIPDYICGVVLHPLKQMNLQPCYYQVNDDLTPDWSDLRNLIDDTTKALLMVHYFGQPQDVERFRDFCKEYNLFLIEDNAHGHGGQYNGQLLGTFGDVGFSSPRKVLDLHSGGILYLNRDELHSVSLPSLPEYPVTRYQYIIKFFSMHFSGLKKYLKKILKSRPPFEDPRAFREPEINDFCIDSASLNEFKTIEWDRIRKERQSAYYSWEYFAKNNKLTSVFKTLNPEASPWCFPAYVKDKKETIRWFKWGWKHGYQILSWPSLPEEIIRQNGIALHRWEQLICFPIENKTRYQELSKKIH